MASPKLGVLNRKARQGCARVVVKGDRPVLCLGQHQEWLIRCVEFQEMACFPSLRLFTHEDAIPTASEKCSRSQRHRMHRFTNKKVRDGACRRGEGQCRRIFRELDFRSMTLTEEYCIDECIDTPVQAIEPKAASNGDTHFRYYTKSCKLELVDEQPVDKRKRAYEQASQYPINQGAVYDKAYVDNAMFDDRIGDASAAQ